MTVRQIQETLLAARDADFAAFTAKTIPTLDPDTVLGVRTPALRQLAKDIAKQPDTAEFLRALPHTYFEENQLHAFLLALEKDFDRCNAQTDALLRYIDNWATCDQLSPKIFAKHADALLPFIEAWMRSAHTYTVRFGIGMLMRHFLGKNFAPEYAEAVAAIRSEEYYINMMCAWYFATALAEQYDAVIGYLTERRLPEWVHKKTIQKAIESYRIPPEQKAFLRTLR